MSNNSDWVSEAAELRRRAQQLAREKAGQKSDGLLTLSLEEIRQLAYELQVHQIELEMQNDELRRTQGELEASRARYFDLYDLAPVGYMTLSDQGLILEANLTVSVMLGMARGDLVKRPFTHFILSEDHGIYYSHQKKLVETGEKQACEFRMLRFNASPFWARMEASTTKNSDGNSNCRVVISDITERNQAEGALRASEERFRMLFERSPLGYQSLDADGRFIEVNQAWLDTLGYEREEVIGHWFGDFLPSRYVDAFRERFPRFKEAGEVHNEFEMTHKDGSLLLVAFDGKIGYDQDHHFKQTHCILRDITERKRAEAEKEKLEAQNRQLQKSESLGRMAGAIAHHFNNQLQVVMMNLDFAMRSKSSGEFATENLTGAMQSARKAAQVSTLMLTYLGQTNAQQKPLNLSDTCLGSLPMLQATIPNGLLLETDFPSIGPVINGNADQIQQVLVNLVTNAWEASLDGRGNIRVAVKVVSASDIPTVNRFPIDWKTESNSYACLEVADKGVGIVPRDMDQLFDPFYSTKFTGHGLGLPVVLGIVRAHNGVVTVESEPGQGSIFRVFLPLSKEAITRPPQLPEQKLPMKIEGTVLVVDDEPSLRNVVATAIKGLGFKVLTAKDGMDGLELFQQHRNDIRLVICDLTMPRMDGWQTIEAMRKLEPSISVILCSGYSEAQAMGGYHPEQPQAFLSKPYEYETLYETISRVLCAKG
jgi:PAS domain S-box-containing protein